MLYDMKTKRDFFKAHEHRAFDIAFDQNPNKNTAWWAAEANLILEEWWRDYQEEHV